MKKENNTTKEHSDFYNDVMTGLLQAIAIERSENNTDEVETDENSLH